MTKSNKIIEKSVDRIIALMEEGELSWNKPWSTTLPCNYITKKPYRGWNQFIAAMSGFSSPYFLTFKQAKKLGGTIKKGSKGLPMIFWKPFIVKVEKEDENGNKVEKKEKRLVAKSFTVFNEDQIEGIDFEHPKGNDNSPIKEIENIVENMPNRPEIVGQDLNRAYYSPNKDIVNMPLMEQFKTSESFYSTLTHELVHSTGHESRLKREGVMNFDSFGSHQYSFEELIAEIGANMLLSLAGVNNEDEERQTAVYVQSWLKKLKDDKMMIYRAATQAQKAVDYITDNQPKYENED